MKVLILIIFYLTMCCAEIYLNIKTSNYLNKTEVHHRGTDVKLVTDEEVALFNITHENLNRGIRVEMGKVPDDVFLRDPTPYENLFQEFKWPEVGRLLIIKGHKVVEFIREDVLIKTHEYINNATETMAAKTDMMEMVENTAMSLWSRDGLPDDYIHYNVSIDFGYGNWIFVDKWRDECLRSVHLPFGATNGKLRIKSGQTVISKLLGTKITMLIEIEYLAKLIGNIIADYQNLYGKYHFYSPALENIMRAAKLKNEIYTKEFLEVRFFAKPRVIAFDKDTGEELNAVVTKRHLRRKDQFIFTKQKVNTSELNLRNPKALSLA